MDAFGFGARRNLFPRRAAIDGGGGLTAVRQARAKVLDEGLGGDRGVGRGLGVVPKRFLQGLEQDRRDLVETFLLRQVGNIRQRGAAIDGDGRGL